MKNLICIIPAKGNSTRLKRKNLLQLGDHPLVGHTILKAIKSQAFKKVFVSTEDPRVAEVSKRYGAEVPFLRPEYLSKDPYSIFDTIRHVYKTLEDNYNERYDAVVVLLPTSPFLLIDDIQQAIKLHEKTPESSLMSVCPTDFPPFNAWKIIENGHQKLSPCFPDSPYKYTKSTECPKTYRSNGAVLILPAETLMSSQDYRQKEVIPFIMPLERSLDIDTKLDFIVAEHMYNAREVSLDKELFS